MNKLIIIAAIILILAILGGFSYLTISHNKEVKGLQSKISELTAQRDSCYDSKQSVKIDTIKVEVPQYIKITNLQPVDSFLVYLDGVAKYGGETPTEVLIRAYKDTLKNKDFSLPYELTVNGYLESVTFGNYTILRKEKTVENIVKVPVNVVREVDRSHLYFYFMFGSSFGRIAWS